MGRKPTASFVPSNGRPLVSIVIPTAGRSPDSAGTCIERCLESIRKRTTYSNYEIIVVASPDLPGKLIRQLDSFAIHRITYRLPFNFSNAVNQGAALARGDYVLLLNDDTEVISCDWLQSLLECARQPLAGAVGCRLLFPDGRLQHAGVAVMDGNPFHPGYGEFEASEPGETMRECLAVTGACLMTPRTVFQEVKGFDRRFYLNYNDVDYCLRLRQRGYRVYYTPHAALYHHEAVSKDGGATVKPKELRLFQRRWMSRWPVDPFYERIFV